MTHEKKAPSNKDRAKSSKRPQYPTPDDFARVAAALASIGQVLAHWLPDGKERGGEWHCKNPTRDDEHAGNFSVNMTTGKFFDFATGEGGADLIALVHYIEGTGHQSDALARLADFLGIDATGPTAKAPTPRKRETKPKAPEPRPIMPVPPEALESKPTTTLNKEIPSQIWQYTNATGGLLLEVWRIDPPDGSRKQFRPLTWWNPGGWQFKAPPPPRPLYRLDQLAARPDAPVLICEGEKSADAAAWLLPGFVCVTSMNGAQSPDKADLSPLAGRAVHIWPDHDEPGRQYAEKIAKRAMDAGAASVKRLDVDFLGINPTTGELLEWLPSGWDAADALADGWNPDNLADRLRWKLIPPPEPTTPDPTPEPPPEPPTPTPDPTPEGGPGIPHGFEIIPKPAARTRPGLYRVTVKNRKDPETQEPVQTIERIWISTPITIEAITRDHNGGEWGRLAEFPDRDGILHRVCIPCTMLAGGGEGLRTLLLRHGLEISTQAEARRMLLDYVRDCRPTQRARTTRRTGWAPGPVFALPRRTIGGGEGGELVLYEAAEGAPPFEESGTLEEWKTHVSAMAAGNSILIFALSLAFAAPILEFSGDESGGFHLRGESTAASSSGKTTCQLVACSVYGFPGTEGKPGILRHWRATDNGIEPIAVMFCDLLLNLDEVGQIDPKAAGEAVYLLANGSAKARARQDGDARALKTWRLLFLSSGEIGLAEHMSAAGKKFRAGMGARFAEIRADGGAGMGIFEDIHGYANPGDFARALASNAKKYHGTALPRFIEWLLEHRGELRATIKELRAGFVARVLGHHADPSGPVRRVADRFALAAIGGELATRAGLTGWEPGAAVKAAAKLFEGWLEERGGAGPQEEKALIDQVRHFLATHGEARFTDYFRARRGDDHAPRTAYRAGFVVHHRAKDPSAGLVTEAPTIEDEEGTRAVTRSEFYVFREVFRSEVCAGYDYKDAERILTRAGILIPGKDRIMQKPRLPGFKNPPRVYVLTLDEPTTEGGA